MDEVSDTAAAVDEITRLLLSAMLEAVPVWAARLVEDRRRASQTAHSPTGRAAGSGERLQVAIASATVELATRFDRFAATAPEHRATTPLDMVRTVVSPRLTRILFADGVPPPHPGTVDGWLTERDPYGLGPASFADIEESLATLGIEWGAASAFHHHRQRRGQDRPPPG